MTRPPNRDGATWATLLLIPVVILLSACTAEREDQDEHPPSELITPSPMTTFNDFDGFAMEYLETANQLADSLPEGVDLPADPPGAWEADGSFEEGTGEVAAVLQWRCEWASAYVVSSDSGMSADARAALDRLAEWSELTDVRDHSDSDTRALWLERVVEPARAGDDTMLRAIQAECESAQ